MIITFTTEQAAELDNPLWDVDYTVTLPDGTELATSTGEDDIREFPLPFVGQLGVITDGSDNITGYACAHPDLTPDDEVVIKAVLDERAAFVRQVAALPREERAAARAAKRTELRTAARQDTRRHARSALRQADRQAARQAYRQELRQDARIAERLAAAQAAREAEASAEADKLPV